MDLTQKMIQDIEEKYHMYLKGGGGILYVFRKLWREYDISTCMDAEDMLERLVFNIIIASMIVKEETDIIEYYGMNMRKILWYYEKNKEKLNTYYSNNDMGVLKSKIKEINTCKNRMYTLKKMIQDIEKDYLMFFKESRGNEYVFIRLWEEYDTYGNRNNKEAMLQTLVFDIIIASMNIKEETSIVASFGMQIRRMMKEYGENKEKLPIYYDNNDIKLIEEMIDQINACKEKWVK